MCIICHYRGDNKLVVPEVREQDHKDGNPECIRGSLCVDCEVDGVTSAHICSRFSSAPSPVEPYDHSCPKCGAGVGELCWSRGFDQMGPKAPIRKSVPCSVRLA